MLIIHTPQTCYFMGVFLHALFLTLQYIIFHDSITFANLISQLATLSHNVINSYHIVGHHVAQCYQNNLIVGYFMKLPLIDIGTIVISLNNAPLMDKLLVHLQQDYYK